MKVGEENDLYGLDFTSDGALLACGGKDGIVRVFNEKNKVCEFDFKDMGFAPHSNRIFCVKFNPFDQNMLISAGWDNAVVINDMRMHKPIDSILGPRIAGDSLDFSKEGFLLTGSNSTSQAIQLWDLKTRAVVGGISWGGGFLPNFKTMEV